MSLDRGRFFARVRADFDSLSQKQVDGFNAILGEWEHRNLPDIRQLAYMLATSWHETAHTMQPIAEYGKGKGRKYGVKGKHGQVAYGRGYVQLTWDYNYERADKELMLNSMLTRNYELALRPDVAAIIMFRGMQEGWFTGKKLSDYINADRCDFKNARRIINGTDKAAMIAGYADDFLKALRAADQPGVVVLPEKPVGPSADDPGPEVETKPKPPSVTPGQAAGGGGVVVVGGGAAVASQFGWQGLLIFLAVVAVAGFIGWRVWKGRR